MTKRALLEAQTKFQLIKLQEAGIKNCARCNRTHEYLSWRSFKEPFEVDSYMVIGWATCPTHLEPILWTAQEEN